MNRRSRRQNQSPKPAESATRNSAPAGPLSALRLGLCCQFVAQPIKFRVTTATALQRLPRRKQRLRLADLCMANAAALLAALRYCAAHGIGSFRILFGAEIHPAGSRTVPRFRIHAVEPPRYLRRVDQQSRNSANPLLAKIQRLFSRDWALENDFLRQENRILRSKWGCRVPLTESDRRGLVKYGLRIKDRLGEVMSIAKPETLPAWHRRQKRRKWTFANQSGKPGRPRQSEDTEALILRLAEGNGGWGYKRLSGELKKLGHRACPSYVRDVLRRHGLPPAPHRQGLSWKQFLQSHLEVTWAADFLTEEVWTLGGLVTFYVLFFLHLGSRRVWIAGGTPQPHGGWMAQQARNFAIVMEDWNLSCRYLVHDRDTRFADLDRVLQSVTGRIKRDHPGSTWVPFGNSKSPTWGFSLVFQHHCC
jgi:hypothetical protein